MKHSMQRYYLIFTAAYIGLTVIFSAINYFISSTSASGAVIIPFATAFLTGKYFLKQEKRLPTEGERRHLTWGSFTIFVGINALLFAGELASGGFSDFSVAGGMGAVLAIAALVYVLIGVVTFFMMRWAYGGLLRKQAERLRDKDDTFD